MPRYFVLNFWMNIFSLCFLNKSLELCNFSIIEDDTHSDSETEEYISDSNVATTRKRKRSVTSWFYMIEIRNSKVSSAYTFWWIWQVIFCTFSQHKSQTFSIRIIYQSKALILKFWHKIKINIRFWVLQW